MNVTRPENETLGGLYETDQHMALVFIACGLIKTHFSKFNLQTLDIYPQKYFKNLEKKTLKF